MSRGGKDPHELDARWSSGNCQQAAIRRRRRREILIELGLALPETLSRASLAVVARRSALRASDSDREQIAERLRHATAEGRLLGEELEDRLGALFSARTYGELDALVADLPATTASQKRRRSGVPSWARGALALSVLLAALAVIAGARHASHLVAPALGAPPHAQARLFDLAPHAHRSLPPVVEALSAGLFATLVLCAALAWMFFRDPPATRA